MRGNVNLEQLKIGQRVIGQFEHALNISYQSMRKRAMLLELSVPGNSSDTRSRTEKLNRKIIGSSVRFAQEPTTLYVMPRFYFPQFFRNIKKKFDKIENTNSNLP